MAYKSDAAMPQISLSEADSLLSKLLSEHIPVVAHMGSNSGAEARIVGFIDSKTTEGVITVSTSGPPIDVDKGFLVFRLREPCVISYGEKRESPESLKRFADKVGESVLIFFLPDLNERLDLIFTI